MCKWKQIPNQENQNYSTSHEHNNQCPIRFMYYLILFSRLRLKKRYPLQKKSIKSLSSVPEKDKQLGIY